MEKLPSTTCSMLSLQFLPNHTFNSTALSSTHWKYLPNAPISDYTTQKRIESILPRYLVKEWQKKRLGTNSRIVYAQRDAATSTMHLVERMEERDEREYWMVYDIEKRCMLHAPRRIDVSGVGGSKRDTAMQHRTEGLEHDRCYCVKDSRYLTIGTIHGMLYILTAPGSDDDNSKIRHITLNDLGPNCRIEMLRWHKDVLLVLARKNNEQDQLMLFDQGLNMLKVSLISGSNTRCSAPLTALDALHLVREYTSAQAATEEPETDNSTTLSSMKIDRRQEERSQEWRLQHLEIEQNSNIFQLTFDQGPCCCLEIVSGTLTHSVRGLSNHHLIALHLSHKQPKKVYSIIRNLTDTNELMACLRLLIEHLLNHSHEPHFQPLMGTILTKYSTQLASNSCFRSLFRRFFAICLRSHYFEKAFQIAHHLGDESMFRTLFLRASENNFPAIAHLALRRADESFREEIMDKHRVWRQFQRAQEAQSDTDSNIDDLLNRLKATRSTQPFSQDEKTRLGAYFETHGQVERAMRFYSDTERERLALLQEKISQNK